MKDIHHSKRHPQKRSRPAGQHMPHPRPLISFTIPSIHDDTTLDCRIYHPPYTPRGNISDHGRRIGSSPNGCIRGAIVAHPYAPLGGSYDDAVVVTVAETLLDKGFLVGTFNFRGAHGSKGSTSWSSRGEVEDYKSMVGLMVHYLHALAVGRCADWDQRSGKATVELILGGYSYGSLIVSQLPTIEDIIASFAHVEEGTAFSEIRLRATHLATETLKVEQASEVETGDMSDSSLTPGGRASLKPTAIFPLRGRAMEMVFGGEETDPEIRRQSREHSRQNRNRSMDVARRSLDVVRKVAKRGDSGASVATTVNVRPGTEESDSSGPHVRSRYLLISPLLPPFSGLLSLSIASMMPHRISGLLHRSSADTTEAGGKSLFMETPTLVVFGGEDGFTSAKRLSVWAEKLQAKSRTLKQDCDEQHRFQWHLIPDAGHFWKEEGVADRLVERIGDWASASTTGGLVDVAS